LAGVKLSWLPNAIGKPVLLGLPLVGDEGSAGQFFAEISCSHPTESCKLNIPSKSRQSCAVIEDVDVIQTIRDRNGAAIFEVSRGEDLPGTWICRLTHHTGAFLGQIRTTASSGIGVSFASSPAGKPIGIAESTRANPATFAKLPTGWNVTAEPTTGLFGVKYTLRRHKTIQAVFDHARSEIELFEGCDVASSVLLFLAARECFHVSPP